MRFRLLALVLALAPLGVDAETLTIENETLRVECDSTSGRYSIFRVSGGSAPVASGWFDLDTVSANLSGSKSGQTITLNIDAFPSAQLEVKPGVPFVLVRVMLNNGSSTNQTWNTLQLGGFSPELPVPLAQQVVRGTGGLHAAGNYTPRAHPFLGAIWDKITRRHYHALAGSYEWLTVADPETQHGIVAGFLSQNRATGVLTPEADGGKLKVEARSEAGRLMLGPGKSETSETLGIGYFEDVRLGLETYASELAKNEGVHLPPQPAGFTTWYMEKNGGAADEKSLKTLGDFIAKNLKPYGMNFVQIDDRWQLGKYFDDGPNKNFTDFNPKGPYPSGMKAAADELRADGLTPGLWFLPFSGAYNDPWFADKQGLFVKKKDGSPYHTAWGGTSLDMTNPAAQTYARNIVTNIAHNWGFSYLKIDGLYTGLAAQQIYINSDYNGADDFGNAVFADPGKTNIEVFRDGLKMVRAAAGPDVFLLGCNTAQNMRVLGGSFGLVDAMRIGPDNACKEGEQHSNDGPPAIAVDWKTWREASPVYGSREYFLNGRVWYNDPDPNYVRSSLTLDEARTEASWSSISGQLFTSSDWLPDLPAERLDIIKRTCAPHGKIARPIDFLANDPPRVWQVIDDTPGARRDVVALFNFDDAPQTVTVPLDRLDLPKAAGYAAFDFWAGQFLPPVKNSISATLAPHACQILAVRALQDHPFVLSTSRHVTQGMIDLTDEAWDAATRTLSGKSQVIAGDPYELRIAAPGATETWSIKSCKAERWADPSRVNGTAGPEPAIVPAKDGSLRASITDSMSSPVVWQIVFN